MDASGRCVYVNKCWYDYTGQADDGGLNRGWLEAVHPDDRMAIEKTFGPYTLRQAANHIYRLRSSHGEYRWMLDTTKPLYDGEDLLGFIGSITDIHDWKLAEDTAKDNELKCKESEYRFRQLVDHLPVGLYVTDDKGHLTLVNPADANDMGRRL